MVIYNQQQWSIDDNLSKSKGAYKRQAHIIIVVITLYGTYVAMTQVVSAYQSIENKALKGRTKESPLHCGIIIFKTAVL